jgi:hypothetical protein
LADTTTTTYKVLANGTATTATTVSCSTLVPKTSQVALANVLNIQTTGTANAFVGTSDVPPTTTTGLLWTSSAGAGFSVTREWQIPLNSSQAFQYCMSAGTSSFTVYVIGYTEDR